ncbi:hypothetical protein ACSNOI_19415 [Actinomadura kijaniata]
MITPPAGDHTEPDEQPPTDDDAEPYVRLPIDPSEPMAEWLAIMR